jgi:glycosyltransferase involved in cell wall biosynthesis
MLVPGRRSADRPRVLIIVQNLAVPFDRRVWLECQTLVGAGYDVTVVCPRDADTAAAYQVIDDVEVYTYPPYAPGGSAVGFVAEYAYSFLATARLALKARRGRRFDVVQACNPPDIFWPLARMLRLRDGSRFVFDHHDLCPELYQSRFAGRSRLALRGLYFVERRTFREADHVISTNESYREIAMRRGGKRPDEVTVVRTGPDADRLRAGQAKAALRRGRAHLVTYIGVMGPQDGVDLVLRAARVVVHELGRQDVSFLLMGKGDCYDDLLKLRAELGLDDFVEMPGRVSDSFVEEAMSTADLGLSPDPKNPLNDLSTMNKTMEYMAYGLPVVAFDLRETRVSAGDAAVYATPNEVTDFARAMVDLIDSPERRREMGQFGRARVENELQWSHQRPTYLGVYEALVARSKSALSVTVGD